MLEIAVQQTCITEASKIPIENLPKAIIWPMKLEAILRIPIARIGDKSTAPICNKRILLKIFKYGSQIFDKN